MKQQRIASASTSRDPPQLSYLNPAALRGSSRQSLRTGTPSPGAFSQTSLSRPNTAPNGAADGLFSPRRKSKFRGTTFLKDTSLSENVLPRPLPSGITYAANFASFEELMERNILEQKQEHVVSLSTDDVSTIYHAKCVDQRLPPSWEREARFMELLSQNCKGMFFVLKENGLGSYATAAICQVLANNQRYSVLELSGNRMRDAGAECVAELLRVNHTIVHLSLRSNDIGQDGGSAIAGALHRNNTLTSLDLSGISGINRNHLGLRGAEAMGSALAENRTLCMLNLGSNGLGAEGMEKLAEGLQANETVTDLNLSSNNLGHEGSAHLAEALQHGSIRILNLDRNSLGDRGCSSISSVMRPPHAACDHLESLSLAYNGIRAAGIEQLSRSLPSVMALRILVLEGNACGDAGFHLAAAMRDNRSIVEYRLAGCDLNEHHAEKLGDSLSFNTMVEVLDISRNLVGDKGMEPILKVAQTHPRLRVILMNNVGASDAVGVHIAAVLAANSTLTELHTRQNNIKASGEKVADVMRKNTTIVTLDVLYNDLSYRAHSAIDGCIQRNRKTLTHNEIPKLTAEINELNSSEKDLGRVQEEMDAERRSTKDKMDDGYRRKETAKNHIEHLKKVNAELEAQLAEVRDGSNELDMKFNELSEHVQREKSKMDGKQTVLESKRRMEEDKKNEFIKQKDRLDKKMRESAESEVEALREPREELKRLEAERDRERNDARTQAEHLVAAEMKLLEQQILLGQAALPMPEPVETAAGGGGGDGSVAEVSLAVPKSNSRPTSGGPKRRKSSAARASLT